MNQLGYVIGQQTLELLDAGNVDNTFTLLDREWDKLAGVFGGDFMGATEFFTEALPLTEPGSFVEMGCGSAVTAVMAAVRGRDPVTAIDINPAAVKNALLNAERHGVAGKVRGITSDLFDQVDPDEKFDTVYWNSPFIAGEALDHDPSYFELAVFDRDYAAHRRFFATVRRHLADGGAIYQGYCVLVGNLPLVEELADRAGFSMEIYRQQVFHVPYEMVGKGPQFAAHADADGLLHPDFTLFRYLPK